MTYVDPGGGGPVGAVERREDARLGRLPPGHLRPVHAAASTRNYGRTIYFTLSKCGPYNVFWYRADLLKKSDG